MPSARPFPLTAVLTLALLACEAPLTNADTTAADSLMVGSLTADTLARVVVPPDTIDVQGVRIARARVMPAGEGEASGQVTLSRTAGGVRVLVEVDGLNTGSYHAVQILRGRDCDADPSVHLGADAGTPHGGPYALPGLRHAGDLGNVRAQNRGIGRYDRIDAALSLDGTMSPMGRAVVIRAGRDDASSPDGAAGEVIGCGVLERVR